MKLLHTKFHYYNISSLGDNIRETLKKRQVFGSGLDVVKVDKKLGQIGSEWVRVGRSTF